MFMSTLLLLQAKQFPQNSATLRVLIPTCFHQGRSTTVESEPISSNVNWNEAIVSWNVKHPESASLTIEARVAYSDHATKWYTLGLWSIDGVAGPRQSVEGQRDDDGTVLTDTLSMKRPGGKLQLRLTGVTQSAATALSLLTVNFADTAQPSLPDNPRKTAWGKIASAPFRAQRNYPDGSVLCSPTSLSMMLAYASKQLNKPELDQDVPQIRPFLYDPVYKGHGNWPFNTAYFGSFSGLRGHVSRLEGIQDLEALTEAGQPVVCSVSIQLLLGRELDRKAESGHLVVLLGFDLNGDPVFNDPAQHEGSHVYRREDFKKAWDYSHRTVYLLEIERRS